MRHALDIWRVLFDAYVPFVTVLLNEGCERVDSRLLKPFVHECVEIDLQICLRSRLLEASHEIVNISALVSKSFEIQFDSILKNLITKVIGNLSDETGTLAIAYLIKYVCCVICVPYRHLNWMCGLTDILVEGFGLVMLECLLWVTDDLLKLRSNGLKTDARTIVCKAFL